VAKRHVSGLLLSDDFVPGEKLRDFPRCGVRRVGTVHRIFANRLGVGFAD
jgi:hypothetical protein